VQRAVNHSIGRSFRKVNDDAVVLFDGRSEESAKLLPEWILRSFEKVREWRAAIDRIDQFFRIKHVFRSHVGDDESYRRNIGNLPGYGVKECQ
jgi:hypothetical protein